jgi:RNA polymerase sigma-70 factor (ECF subfamily)
MTDARAIAEETARASYGRLLAWLAARTGDVAAAEDALANAFRAALEHWPKTGAPASPEAWIITTARRKLIDDGRRRKTRAEGEPALMLAAEEAEAKARADKPFPDERLKLLFICAHPAIEATVRTPLMLQTVLGLDAARIASAFLTSPKAMGARLVRAKRKIKTAAIPFAEPPLEALPERISAVLDAIYAAFGTGWNEIGGADETHDLAAEAIYLARLAADLVPDESEAWGLLSLMLHADARRSARCAGGAYVPLQAQDTALWDRKLIAAAEAALARAWKVNRIGRYQLEAAIQSAHAASRLHGRAVTDDVILLYERLLALAPSAGAHVGYAAALSAAGRCADGLAALDALSAVKTETYQPYWAVRGHLLAALGDRDNAQAAYDRAIGLSADEAVRTFLFQRKTASSSSTPQAKGAL